MGLLTNLLVFFTSVSSVLSQPFFTTFEPIAPPLIEWDQANTTYYTGQTIQMNWTSQGFISSDLARIQYAGSGGTRTLTSGSGTSIQTSTYSIRLSDSSNGVASLVPLTIAHATNTTNALQSTTRISVIQSKVTNITPLDGTKVLGGGQNTVCDDRNLTVSWRGLGEAQFGVATVSLNRQGGFGGGSTLGTTQTNIPVSGNTSVTFFCPRTSSPSTFNAYAFQISVVETGGNAYTGTSASFNVAVAATPTPTPTSSTTPSATITPSPSQTPSNTPSPSETSSTTPSPSPSKTPSPSTTQSRTPTPSITPTISPTPSTTETARPSIDYAAIARNAAESVDTSTPAIAGALGGIGGLLLVFGAYKVYQNKRMTERRKQKQAMTSRFVQQASSIYGIQSSDDPEVVSQPSIVMYTVAGMPQRNTDSKSLTSIKKGFPPKPIVHK